MKSNVCKIEKGTKDLDAILKESERVAEYNALTHKQALQLRLLCEEIDGMLPNIMSILKASFGSISRTVCAGSTFLLKSPSLTPTKRRS